MKENSKKAQDLELINKKSRQLKINLKEAPSAIIRSVFDGIKGSLGGGTIPQWQKVVKFVNNKEQEAYNLLSNSLINTLKVQLEEELDKVCFEQNNLVYLKNTIRFEVFDQLKTYTFNTDFIDNPSALPFIKQFKPIFQQWLIDSFSLSVKTAQIMASSLPYYFADEFYKELTNNSDKYKALSAWKDNPNVEKWALEINRQKYLSDIKSFYRKHALGEQGITLADVYIEPTFQVYEDVFPEEKQREIKLGHSSNNQHFLPVKYDCLHDYILNHFVTQKQSKAIQSEEELSRMLVLLGHPGHGKSSFCYRTIYDLLESSDFNGVPFFIKLQDAEKSIINNPLPNIQKLLPKSIEAEDWMDEKYQEPIVLFLDGLDEFYMTQSLSDTEIISFVDNCKKLIRQIKSLHIIITSRFNYVETSKLFQNDCLIFELGKLSATQQSTLVQKYEARIRKKSNIDLSELNNQNYSSNYQHIRELIELPILLQMILISDVDITNAASKADIYTKLFETVINRKWSKDKRLKKYQQNNKKFKPKHLRSYLSWIAFRIFQNNKGYVHKSSIVSHNKTQTFTKKYLRIQNEEGDVQDVLKDILTSFYLKETKKTDKNQRDKNHEYAIEFLHKSLYEYLACEFLWNEIKGFFTKKDDDGDYEHYDFETIQKKLKELFALTRLTHETVDYLKEIISSDANKKNVLNQMAGSFSKLLKSGFINEFYPTDKFQPYLPEQQVLHSFHIYILIIGELNKYINDSSLKENISKEKKQFSRLIRLVGSEHLITTLNLSNLDLSDADLSRVDLSGANLSDANLSKAGLSEADLSGAYLMRADLSEANSNRAGLSGANLSNANLNQADLSGADLNQADLYRADLNGACLYRADLSKANLIEADLNGAYLVEANLCRASLFRADLSEANLSRAQVGTQKWIEDIKEQNTYKSYVWIKNNYIIDTELKEFTDRYGNDYEAYEIIKK